MMKIKSLLIQKNKTLIIAYNGINISGIVADSQRIYTKKDFLINARLKAVLDFGKNENCKNVLILKISEIREIDLRLGSNIDDDERKSAIEYATESAYGNHSKSIRVAYLDNMVNDFHCGILTSIFETTETLQIAQEIANEKLIFLGILSFSQLLLVEHFSKEENKNVAFLSFIGNNGFLVIPENHKLVIRNLPFGVNTEKNDEAWQEKISRRFSGLKNKDIKLYSPIDTEDFCKKTKPIIEVGEIINVNWENSLNNGIIYFLNMKNNFLKTALPPLKAKDPNSAGTLIGTLFFLAVLLIMITLAVKNIYTIKNLEQIYSNNVLIEEKIRNEELKISRIAQEFSLEKEMYQMINNGERISRKIILVINLLGRYQLQYTKINSIIENKNGIFLEGETVWQPDLSKFFSHFDGELQKHNLSLFSENITQNPDGRITFQAQIKDGGK